MDVDAKKAAAVLQRLQLREDKRRAQADEEKAHQRQVNILTASQNTLQRTEVFTWHVYKTTTLNSQRPLTVLEVDQQKKSL